MKIGLAVRVTLDLFPDTLGVLDPRDIKLDSGRVLRIEADKRSRLQGARFKALARKDYRTKGCPGCEPRAVRA
jgi:hypothetical protein